MSKIAPYQWREDALAEKSDQKIRFLNLDKKLFYDEFLAGLDVEMFRIPMQDLIKRYDIRGKKVLSIGPGECRQEYWFSFDKNSLLLVDIDEGGELEPRLLRAESSKDRDSTETVSFALGDARRLNDYLVEPFDVLLSFSFTPDEYHRTKVQNDNKKHIFQSTWPIGAQAFSPLLCEMFKQLPEGALLLSLSYCGGPDATSLTYLASVKDTLNAQGMKFLEAYVLKSSPGVHLVVAQKGLNFQSDIPYNEHSLSTIHPRGSAGERPVAVFSTQKTIDSAIVACKAEDITSEILRNNFKRNRNCIYEGDFAGEVLAFLKYGYDTQILADKKSAGDIKIFPEMGTLKFVSFRDLEFQENCYLLWLGSITRDDNFRKQNICKLGMFENQNTKLLFSDETHTLLKRCHPEVFVTYGLAGVDITDNLAFRAQLERELRSFGLFVHTLSALKVESGFFMLVACRDKAFLKLDFSLPRIYPGSEDNAAIKIYDVNNPPKKPRPKISFDFRPYARRIKRRFSKYNNC